MRKKLSVFFSVGIMVVMLAACGSSNDSTSPSSDVPNGKEETSTTGQIVNNDSESSVDSSVDSTSTPEPTPTEEPSSTPTQEPTETPTPTPTEEPTPTPEPTPTETPTPTPEPTPTETPTPTPSEEDKEKEPNGSAWSGNYDSLVTEGFDHIKVPTIDSFYSDGLKEENSGTIFEFGRRPEWEEVWYDAYNEFLVANGSPIIDDTPIGAFYAINPGSTFINGKTYQYLYYGFRGDADNGWGDIVIYPGGMYAGNSSLGDERFNAYFLELSNFTFGNMDKGLENEYRSATMMLLSWICPNPSQVEQAIYDTFVEDHCVVYDNWVANGYFSWVQVGDVDVCVIGINTNTQAYTFGIRNHK